MAINLSVPQAPGDETDLSKHIHLGSESPLVQLRI